MQRLWSPWRSAYIQTFKEGGGKRASRQSLFTKAWKAGDDEANLILWRGRTCFTIMNRYPYNAGHIMVVPYRQVGSFEDLRPGEIGELMEATRRAIRVLNRVLKPHGYNFGANLGRVSGAGIENHVHFHLVPRWNGDTNFMPVLAEVKVVSESLEETFRKLREAFSGGDARPG